MPMLEMYRHYFDIDPDYFPAVNEAVIMNNPEMWKKFFSARDVCETSGKDPHGFKWDGAEVTVGGGCLRYR